MVQDPYNLPKKHYMDANRQISIRSTDWRQLLSYALSACSTFNAVNWSTALSKLGRMQRSSVDSMKTDSRYYQLISYLCKAMTMDVGNNLEVFATTPQAIANIVHSLAKLHCPVRDCKPILAAVNQQATWLVESGNTLDIANLAWAFATLGFHADHMFDEIEKHAAFLVTSGEAQHIANVSWAAATLGHACPLLFLEMNEEKCADFIVKEGTPQAIANTAWAAATLGHSCSQLFKALDDKCSQFLVETGKPQEIANTAWAAATLGENATGLFRAIEASPECVVESHYTVDVSHTAWACGKLQYDCPTLMKAVDNQSERVILEGSTQAISNVAMCEWRERRSDEYDE